MNGRPRIYAGTRDQVRPNSGKWIFVDIGFSNASKSCGILVDGKDPEEVTFTCLKEKLRREVERSDRPVNLVIEAPLSVAFKNGNPTGRSFEKRDGKTRYWYVGLGCSVLVAATYLLRDLNDHPGRNQEIRLFEGFVTFKNKAQKSSHIDDVKRLKEAVFRDPPDILESDYLGEDIELESAFKVAGMDFGVPLVVNASDAE